MCIRDRYINVFSVDNVLQRIADPVFLGAVLTEGFLSGGKVVKKAYPDEKDVYKRQVLDG